MTQAITMTRFVYNSETAHEDFPEWKFLFENYLVLSGIDKTDTTKTPSGAAKALQNLIHAGGQARGQATQSNGRSTSSNLRNPDGGNGDVVRTKARRLIKIQVGHHETKGWRISLRLCDQIKTNGETGWHRDGKSQ